MRKQSNNQGMRCESHEWNNKAQANCVKKKKKKRKKEIVEGKLKEPIPSKPS